MFAERFDALMNIAEVSNSLLGRNVNMNPSHIGRLRSGARPLPKNHEYLSAMCRCLAEHIKKDYQINALQKLTGIGSAALSSLDEFTFYLEHWLLESGLDTHEATGRLISGFSRISPDPSCISTETKTSDIPYKYAEYLYGDAGKRKAVEQFLTIVLHEDKPQTLLLFSDENMSWLYEDAPFAARWAELLTKVIIKGNRVRIIHTLSRDMNEMLEAVTKWMPIYMSGMIEPYFYPKLRDGIFNRTLFIAPNTAAVVSSSIQQDTDGMLNLFITDKAALSALTAEYEHYFSLCRPLMHIYTGRDTDIVQKTAENLATADGNAFLCSALPPLFTMPQETVSDLCVQNGNNALLRQWECSLSMFENIIKKQHLTLVLQNPKCLHFTPDMLCPPNSVFFSEGINSYKKSQYDMHIKWLGHMEKKYENFSVIFVDDFYYNTLLYIKENEGIIMTKSGSSQTAFIINERNITSAFWDYAEKCLI